MAITPQQEKLLNELEYVDFDNILPIREALESGDMKSFIEEANYGLDEALFNVSDGLDDFQELIESMGLKITIS